MKPKFLPGKNIAMKVPSHEYERTIDFYENILGFRRKQATSPDQFESVVFEFGEKNLWIDNVNTISQAELWLEIETSNVEEAKAYLADNGCVICDEIEPLPESFRGFWISSPSNIIHLVVE